MVIRSHGQRESAQPAMTAKAYPLWSGKGSKRALVLQSCYYPHGSLSGISGTAIVGHIIWGEIIDSYPFFVLLVGV